jgi:hypothetical protein
LLLLFISGIFGPLCLSSFFNKIIFLSLCLTSLDALLLPVGGTYVADDAEEVEAILELGKLPIELFMGWAEPSRDGFEP